MPYISRESRPLLEPTSQREARKPGELNFQVTRLCHRYIQTHGLSYENINAAVGALECAKLELYRRLAAPYEDGKILENGDIT